MIEITDVRKIYGTTAVLDGVSLTARPGQVTALVGPNGAGKSTLMRVLLGLEVADGGTAHLCGRRYDDLVNPQAMIGAALDPTWLAGARRARDELRLAAAAGRLPRSAADAALSSAGLANVAEQRVRSFSLGMRQRLSLARAIIAEPAILVLDEPTNGLDVDGVLWLRQLLRSYADGGATVLFSSHVLTEIDQIADRIIVLQGGRITLDRAVAAAGEDQDRFTVTAMADEPGELARLLTERGMTVFVDGRRLSVSGQRARTVAALAYTAGIFVESVFESQRSLEDEYRSMVEPAAIGAIR
ncbi:ATP-binding cassette domain-containing protein [Microbacterium sp.]|uniref:ATP-binding cassette domain-containing protein n=1 Tax=Microbacterium sp. TaxID=51671 RepID=UPI00260DA951|nr:ATP-binding cassette domain-containing protein [Microbacterium sp.]